MPSETLADAPPAHCPDLHLLPQHAALLAASASAPAVATARGYRSVTSLEHLVALGFDRRQCNVPGLLLPILPPGASEPTVHQYRPDVPRVLKKRALKYETPAGSLVDLDCPLPMRAALADLTRPLWLTEGVRKADSLASVGEVAVAAVGVDCFMRNGAPLPAWNHVPLEGRLVVLAFDSDVLVKTAVRRALEKLGALVRARGVGAVRYCVLPHDDETKCGVDDFLAAHSLTDLWACVRDDLPPTRRTVAAPAARDGRPTVLTTNRQLGDLEAECLAHLRAANVPPAIFARGTDLVRVVRDAEGAPILRAVSEAALRNLLADAADFFHQRGDAAVAIAPPLDIPRAIAARLEWPGFPPVRAIARVPIVRPDGTLVTTPGYDAPTTTVYVPPAGFILPPVPETPTAADVAAARERLLDVLVDFPFVDTASRANLLGLLLTPFLRPGLAGVVPLCAIDKPVQGSGAGLLVDAVSLIATGEGAAIQPAPVREEEMDKALTAAIRDGRNFVVLDNLVHPLGSPALAAAITATVWEKRVLGETRTVRLYPQVTWVATGNNIRLREDLPRRTYHVRLDAGVEFPDQRPASTFRHPRLLAYVRAQRAELVAAVLVLIRAWYAQGCPPATIPAFGGFEGWAETVGGILAAAGIDGFLATREALRAEADDDAAIWRAFLVGWHEAYASRDITVRDLVADLRSEVHPTMVEALPVPDPTDRAFSTRLGTALRSRKDRVIGTVRLVRATGTARAAAWRVEPCIVRRVNIVPAPPPREKGTHTDAPARAPARTREGRSDYVYSADYARDVDPLPTPEAAAPGRETVRL